MPSRPRDVVVVGASAGGVEALRALVSHLPPDLPASVLVVLHLPAGGTSALPAILDRVGPLPAVRARTGDRLDHGRIYVAPPDHHLLVIDGTVALSHGPTENGHRPAVNALFRSAALSLGAAATGVLLSGVLDDGVAGLTAIAERGGRVLVQDPADALHTGMPKHALDVLTPDHVVPAADMGPLLGKITTETVEYAVTDTPPTQLRWENDLASTDWSGIPNLPRADRLGDPSPFSCPDCHGVLVDLGDGRRYRCQVGHAWTADALLAAQGSELDRALWIALRVLEEKVALGERMADRARDRGSERVAERYDLLAEEARDAADVLRGHTFGGPRRDSRVGETG